MTLALVLGCGLLAGLLTTLAGLGGGLLLLLVLSAVWSPAEALAITAPALLVGNLHRAWLGRTAIDRRVVRTFALGAVPGALLGGLAAGLVSPAVVRGLLVALTVLSLARALAKVRVVLPRSALAAGGLVVGGLTGASGGAGVLAAPLLLSWGLLGRTYVATGACCAAIMHVGRIVGYGAVGLFSPSVLGWAAVTTAAVVGGNCLGHALRRLPERLPAGALEHGVLAVCVTLALLGFA